MKVSVKQGLLQALGVGVYIFLIGSFMFNVGKVFPGPDGFWAPILALLLFSTSALICGLIVFLKPYKLFFDGKKKEATQTVIYTTVWLFVILLTFLLGILVFR